MDTPTAQQLTGLIQQFDNHRVVEVDLDLTLLEQLASLLNQFDELRIDLEAEIIRSYGARTVRDISA